MSNVIAVCLMDLINVFMFVCFDSWIKYTQILNPVPGGVMNESGHVTIPEFDVILSETVLS